jgi:hypothetical protein
MALTPAQRRSLRALVDTFMPALNEEEVALSLEPDARHGDIARKTMSAARVAQTERVLRMSGSELGSAAAVEDLLTKGILSWEESSSLVLVLNLLGSSLGSAVLCSANPFRGSFAGRCVADREALLLGLSGSPLAVQRKAFNRR